ncbi:MAG TPA: hypothetical protein VH539_24410 [Gemmatimonadaceae bacterium]
MLVHAIQRLVKANGLVIAGVLLTVAVSLDAVIGVAIATSTRPRIHAARALHECIDENCRIP